MPKAEWIEKISLAVFSCMAHMLAYLQLNLHSNSSLPTTWDGQSTCLGACSLVLTLIQPFVGDIGLFLVMIIIRSGILLLLGYPLGEYLGLEMTLYAALIVEVVGRLGVKAGALVSVLLAILLVVMQRPVIAWGVHLPAPSAQQLLDFVSFVALAIITTCVIWHLNHIRHSLMEDIHRLRESVKPLTRANKRLQEYAIVAGQQAMLTERKRLARELHDTTSYTLANLTMMLEAAINLAPQDAEILRRHLELARDHARVGLSEIRNTFQELRRAEPTKPTGLKAVRLLVDTFAKTAQIHIDLTISAGVPENLGEEADLTVFRLIQEGLTNALRHGQATKITITFVRLGQTVNIEIKDNGVGVSSVKEGYGLTGMRERVAHLGGQIRIYSEPGLGFLLLANIPIGDSLRESR